MKKLLALFCLLVVSAPANAQYYNDRYNNDYKRMQEQQRELELRQDRLEAEQRNREFERQQRDYYNMRKNESKWTGNSGLYD